MTHLHINCSDFRAEIGNLLEGDVDPQFRAQLEAHLAECQACTVIYDSVRKTIRILADTNTFELSANELKTGTESIMARIRSLKEQGLKDQA